MYISPAPMVRDSDPVRVDLGSPWVLNSGFPRNSVFLEIVLGNVALLHLFSVDSHFGCTCVILRADRKSNGRES